MSAIEKALFSCGILNPMKQLLDKHKNIDIWTVQILALNALASKTGEELKFRAAVRRMHKLITARDENIGAQQYSSSESDIENAKEEFNGNTCIYLAIFSFALLKIKIKNL